jgi:hypothetical protein
MNFTSTTNSAGSETEQKLEAEIRQVPGDGSHADQFNDDVKLTSNNLESLTRRISLTSTREIDSLIGELKTLREKLLSDGSRVERQLTEYTELNQSVVQLTKIIYEGLTHLKKEPPLPKASGLAMAPEAEGVL